MPVELQWHSKLPVLMAEYSGTLTSKVYYAMCDKRRKMLDNGPDLVVIIANMQQLENVRDAESFERNDDDLFDGRVASTLVVLPNDLYRRVIRALDVNNQSHFPVQFFGDMDSALAAVGQLVN